MVTSSARSATGASAFIITGPTSGFGLATAMELANVGPLVLVGRNRDKLDALRIQIERSGHTAFVVECDLSALVSVDRAATEIVALGLPIAGLVNNAGVLQMRPAKTERGLDVTFATNFLGPFLLTEKLLPHLPDGANVVFIASGVEDPERKPAKQSGFRGGRFISVEASARGHWLPGGSTMPGADAYATSKQCLLAAAIEFARESPRLHINAVEPGFAPGTQLAREAHAAIRALLPILSLVAPYIKYWTTPRRAGRLIARVAVNVDEQTGIYFDDNGSPMLPSELLRDATFTMEVMTQTREFLASQHLIV